VKIHLKYKTAEPKYICAWQKDRPQKRGIYIMKLGIVICEPISYKLL